MVPAATQLQVTEINLDIDIPRGSSLSNDCADLNDGLSSISRAHMEAAAKTSIRSFSGYRYVMVGTGEVTNWSVTQTDIILVVHATSAVHI